MARGRPGEARITERPQLITAICTNCMQGFVSVEAEDTCCARTLRLLSTPLPVREFGGMANRYRESLRTMPLRKAVRL